MRIYVASSWRNPWQPDVVRVLRELGHMAYDFKNPEEGNRGFHWSDVDPEWKSWGPDKYRKGLVHPVAEQGFAMDMRALEVSDACVAVLPHGRSAALELGWACGAGKRTAVLFPVGMRMAPAGGHSVDSQRACSECGSAFGCRLPDALNHVEPELMVKMAGMLIRLTHRKAGATLRVESDRAVLSAPPVLVPA